MLKWKDPNGLLNKYERTPPADEPNWHQLKAQSILGQYGYSVKASIAKEDRQKTLQTVIENKRIPKDAVIRHIRSLIARNQNRYPAACNRWKEDVAFVEALVEQA